MLRLLALAACGTFVWMVGLSGLPSHVRLPVEGVVIGAAVSQRFGCTNLELEPFSESCPAHHFHSGIDLAAPAGTEVFSATSGLATTGDDPTGAGLYVVIRFDHQTRILYCHLSSVRVRPGTEVEPGQVIGTVGATGLATGAHLHLEVDVAGIPVDPAVWLAATP